jgi:hypothetical protein
MSRDNKSNRRTERDLNTSQSRNNAGTLGSEGGYEKEPKGSFHELTERLSTDPVNEQGIGENEEDHSRSRKSKKVPGGHYERNEIDPNKRGATNSSGENIQYPKKGYNHVDNPGGTSAEELDKSNDF